MLCFSMPCVSFSRLLIGVFVEVVGVGCGVAGEVRKSIVGDFRAIVRVFAVER